MKNLHASDEHSDKTSVSESAQKSSTPSVISTCAPDSDRASLTASSSVSTSDVIGDLLILPQPKITKKKRKQGFNEKAICITDDSVLKEKKEEKERKKEEMITKRIEREKKREQKKKKQ